MPVNERCKKHRIQKENTLTTKYAIDPKQKFVDDQKQQKWELFYYIPSSNCIHLY